MEAISNIRDLVNLWPTRSSLANDLQALCPSLNTNTARVYKWAEHGAIPARYQFSVLTAGRCRGFEISAELIVKLHSPSVEEVA